MTEAAEARWSRIIAALEGPEEGVCDGSGMTSMTSAVTPPPPPAGRWPLRAAWAAASAADTSLSCRENEKRGGEGGTSFDRGST